MDRIRPLVAVSDVHYGSNPGIVITSSIHRKRTSLHCLWPCVIFHVVRLQRGDTHEEGKYIIKF
jgi:hypothetical protein